MEVGGQFHAPASLHPEKSRYSLDRKLGRPQRRSACHGEKSVASGGNRNPIPQPSSPWTVAILTGLPRLLSLLWYTEIICHVARARTIILPFEAGFPSASQAVDTLGVTGGLEFRHMPVVTFQNSNPIAPTTQWNFLFGQSPWWSCPFFLNTKL
jgi:hypothetical protein